MPEPKLTPSEPAPAQKLSWAAIAAPPAPKKSTPPATPAAAPAAPAAAPAAPTAPAAAPAAAPVDAAPAAIPTGPASQVSPVSTKVPTGPASTQVPTGPAATTPAPAAAPSTFSSFPVPTGPAATHPKPAEPEPIQPEPVAEANVPAAVPEPAVEEIHAVVEEVQVTETETSVEANSGFIQRQLNSDAAVVLPSNGRAARLGVQFGSLNLVEDTVVEPETVEEKPAEPAYQQQQPAPQQPQNVPQQPQQPQQQPPQQPQQPAAYNSYRYNNQRQGANQYAQQGQPQPPTQPQALAQQQKAYASYVQNQYMYPNSHPSHLGFNNGFNMPNEYPYGAADPQRGAYGNYYNPYQQQAIPQDLNRGGILDQSSNQQGARYGSDKASTTSQSPAAGTAPAIAGADPHQYQQHMGYYNPGYGYYYQYGYPQQQYGNHQKNFYNQQSYYNMGGMDYRQQMPQGQQPQQANGQGLSGISDFLQREDKAVPGSPGLVNSQVAGQPGQPQQQPGAQPQAQPGQQPQQPGQPEQPQYPGQQQQNLYSFAGYGHYGQGRQNWNYGN